MTFFDSPVYDLCKKWIQRKRGNDVPWDVIRMAGKQTDTELDFFLFNHSEEDDWPRLTVDEWKALVDENEAYESKQQDIRFRGNEGVLYDTRQDNSLRVPESERSCWIQYKNSLAQKWKPSSVEDLEYATIGILKRLSLNTQNTGPIKGLVVGHVQSGKTANMEALMAMAADHGWNMFIVLSGSIENLRLQTLRRMQKDLNHEGNLIWRGIEHPSKRSQYGEKSVDCHFEKNAQSRYFTVCLKNKGRLQNLIDWLHADRASHEQMKILIIDDEADQASISNTATEYQKELKERKGINKLIVDLVEDRHYKEGQSKGKATAINYVMYTATPYANFLNESTDESLYPKNFIWTLKTSDEYIGPNQIYGTPDPDKADSLDIVRVISDSELDYIIRIYNGESLELPQSLKDSICWFICATAVMRFWGYKKPISMLVHTSQKQIAHEAIANAISYWINNNRNGSIVSQCCSVYKAETTRISKEEWLKQFSGYGVPSVEVKDYPDYSEIKDLILELLSVPLQHIKMTDEGELEYHKV